MFFSLIRVDSTMYTYLRLGIRCILTSIYCVSGCNDIYQMYTELYWCSSKVESCSGVSPIRGNCNGVYPINPSKSGSNLITLPQMWWFSVIYLMHAESLGSGCVQVGEDLHVPVFMAKHATFRVFLRKLCALAIE
jgi:hypothetical protein